MSAIIECVLFCGRQEIALRAHRDAGPLALETPVINDGNLRSLVRIRIESGDEALLDHILNSGANSMYLSPEIQNELINIIGQYIQQKIVAKINKSKFFTVLADETTDISRIEQFSLCVRYLDNNDIREDFLTFVPVQNVTGSGLAKTLKETLVSLGLDLNKMRGQGYDGAAAMSGTFRGCQAIIRDEFPKALYTHCVSHCLNLCLNDASKVTAIKNTIGTIGEVCTFFRISAHRSAVLKTKLKDDNKSSSTLIKYCETRWVERHDSVCLFVECIIPIVLALEDLRNDDKAVALHRRLCSFDFLISLKICAKILEITKCLSEYLQKKTVDLSLALEAVDNALTVIQTIRDKSEENFAIIFAGTVTIASTFNVEPKIPRIVGVQRHRENFEANTAEEYFRRSIFVPYLDDIICSLRERFTGHKEIVSSLQSVLPSKIILQQFSAIKAALNFYRDDLNRDVTEEILNGEWELWRSKWAEQNQDLPNSASDVLKQCNEDLFPNIRIIVELLANLPVTTATVERSFSTLKRLKDYLRNKTENPRLTGFALMAIHRDIKVNVEEILNVFARTKRRFLL